MNTASERNTPIMMPRSRCGANSSVLTKVITEMMPSWRCAFQACMKPDTLIRPITAIMMIAASTAWGRWYSKGVNNSSTTTTARLVNTLDSPDTAPACRLTAEREKEPEVG